MIELDTGQTRHLHKKVNGKNLAVGFVYCDTFDELEDVTEIGDVKLHFGSKAITAEGDICMLDSMGIWHILNSGGGGGGSGTDNYNQLSNKPKINDITLSGNKSLEDLSVEPLTAAEIQEMFNN